MVAISEACLALYSEVVMLKGVELVLGNRASEVWHGLTLRSVMVRSNFNKVRGGLKGIAGLLTVAIAIASFCARAIPLVSIVKPPRCCIGVESPLAGLIFGWGEG